MIKKIKLLRFVKLATSSALLGSVILASSSSYALFTPKRHIATELQEVRTGSINGLEYLTIHIADSVGPSTCHGSVLKVDTASFNQQGKQAKLETVALSAMLNSDSVLITVPLRWDDCLDGLPTLSDMVLLPASP
ncbi:MAG: hypothetical protein V3U65_10495 [Granulosicoccaceae bacterium]